MIMLCESISVAAIGMEMVSKNWNAIADGKKVDIQRCFKIYVYFVNNASKSSSYEDDIIKVIHKIFLFEEVFSGKKETTCCISSAKFEYVLDTVRNFGARMIS